MSLSPNLLALITDGLVRSGLSETCTVRLKAKNGELSQPCDPVAVAVVADEIAETFNGHQTRLVRRLTLRPLAVPMRGALVYRPLLGDEITCRGETFVIKGTSGADLARWIIEKDDPLAVQRADRPRAVGGA